MRGSIGTGAAMAGKWTLTGHKAVSKVAIWPPYAPARDLGDHLPVPGVKYLEKTHELSRDQSHR